VVRASAGAHRHALEDGHEHLREVIDGGLGGQVAILQGPTKAARNGIERRGAALVQFAS
jgi:hypothetical protein